MNTLKEALKILAVVFAAWITFLVTAPESYAEEAPVVPTQEEFNYQAMMTIKAAASCNDYAVETYLEKYGETYDPEGFRMIAQSCVDARTKPYVDQLNEWGNTLLEEDMRRLGEAWDALRDEYTRGKL